MRLIDADLLEEYCKRMINDKNSGAHPVSWSEAYSEFLDDVQKQPTTSSNEVIRCVECAYFSKSAESVGRITLYHCAKRDTGTSRNGFCHYAERRDF